MADSEDTQVKEETAEEQAAPNEAAPPSEAPAEEPGTEEAPAEAEAAREEAPSEEAKEKEPNAEVESTAEAPAEDGGEQKTEAAEEDAKPADEDPGEGEKPAEGEQQADSLEQPAESSEQAAVDGAEQVDSSEAVEAGEAAEGAEPAEQVEGGEPAESGEPVEGAEATEAGEAAEAGKPTEEGSEKPDEPEGEEGAEVGEKKEEGEEEIKQTEGEEQVDGESAKEAEEDLESRPEGAESPIGVGEKLSRDPTPDMGKEAHPEQERIEASTPEKLEELPEGSEDGEHPALGDEEEMVVEEEEVDEPQFRRDELIEKYHDALTEREQLQQQNYSLQHKLAEYFRKKKADERQDYDKNVTDQEQRYLKYMAQLEDLRRQDSMEKENFRAQIEDAKDRCQEKKEKVDVERKKFMEFKKQVALNAINSRSGKPIPPKDIEQYMVNEVKKEQEVVNVRLENIKLKNKLKKKEQQLKSKEELAEGLHLIDFEQLKIENQTYNEKIEERNEELLKLRKKITGTVQVLTHLKEKLQFVQGENLEQNNQLKEVEATLAQSRDILSRTKQARDALRIDNQRLRQNCGLLGNEPLLRDFEERKDEGDDLRAKLEQLRMKHAELTLHCNQVRRKIDQARQSMA